MAAIRSQIKRASLASHRRCVATARLRLTLSMETEPLPGDGSLAAFAAQAQRYRPNLVLATQDLSTLQAQTPRKIR